MNPASILRDVDRLLTQLVACNRKHFDGNSRVSVAREASVAMDEAWQSLRPHFLALRHCRSWPASFPSEATIDELVDSSLSWKKLRDDVQEEEFANWCVKIGQIQRELLQWSGMMAALTSGTVGSTESLPLASTKPKRSTERGEAREKLIAALTKHHEYADGGCLNQPPIGNNELARQAGVSDSTASAFFNSEFNNGKRSGHIKYRAICTDVVRLVAALKLLNREFTPHHLFGGAPSGEVDHDDED